MDLNDLNKRQLILLTLLITFVVSIATGIVTVSLMNQMPKIVPQTINNVIQRTIERVTTVSENIPTKTNEKDDKNNPSLLGDDNAIVSIYNIDSSVDNTTVNSDPSNGENSELDSSSGLPSENEVENNLENKVEPIGQGVIISEMGLILVDSNILNNGDKYKIILNDINFEASVLKKFNNNFTILKIMSENESSPGEEDKLEIDQNKKNN